MADYLTAPTIGAYINDGQPPADRERTLLDILADGQGRTAWLHDTLGQYVPPEIRNQLSLLSMLNPVNDVYEAGGDTRRGDYGSAVVNTLAAAAPMAAAKFGRPVADAVVDTLTGIGAGADDMARGVKDSARRFATDESGAMKTGGGNFHRAASQGYSNEVFYRGDTMPDEYPGGGFFSRDQEYAEGFARKAGSDKARGFRLKNKRVLPLQGTITLGDWADIVRAAPDAAAAQRIVDAAPIDGTWDVSNFLRAADANANVELMRGAMAHQLLERAMGDATSTLKAAGFDAIDTGRDVRKLDGRGIRLKDAEFDPARADEIDINASLRSSLFDYFA